MKYRTIRKIELIILLAIVIIGTIIEILLILKEGYSINIIQALEMLIFVIICLYFLKEAYKEYVILTREKCKWNKEFSKEELEIINDAKNLIKSVDENIEIAEFNVYKVRHVGDGWFSCDRDTHELNIFIPFDRYLKRNKDLCFMITLHEILHSQNLKKNEEIFKTEFCEGINQFLTLWLIDNYSKKYKIPKDITIICFELETIKIGLKRKLNIYEKEVEQAEIVMQNSKQEIKKIFLNYIDLKSDFFKSFVPKKYLKK